MHNNTYLVDPNLIRFNPKYIGFNPIKSAEQYEALKEDIRKRGQDRPIIIKDGLCHDGANRCKAAIELGIKVLCVDVDSDISDKDLLMICNADTFTGRNFTTSQKAIAAYKMVQNFRYSDIEANTAVGLKPNDKGISHARTIAASQYGKDNNILDKLMAGEAVSINKVRTKSTDIAKRLIKKLEEEELLSDKLSEINQVQVNIDYNSMIECETIRDMFWKWMEMDPVSARLEMIRMLHIALEVDVPAAK